MRIPLIWLKDYVESKKSPKEIAESFTLLGLMLDKNIDNKILDLEHRMDRSDWLSIIGCARDLAAFEGLNLKYPEMFTGECKPAQPGQGVEIKVECPELVRRFNTRIFKNIKVGPSPAWIKERLEAYGIPSINNIVDITNFVMVEMGQPMHAQDLAKMEKREIVIRRAKVGEELITLLGQQITLDPDCFVLTQNGKATVLGGIVGTSLTAVDGTTTEIVLDAGNYDQVNIRKNSRKLKIQNETVLRYDKFLSPKLTEIAISRATKLILDLAEGECFLNIDYYPEAEKPKRMKLRYDRIGKISGMNISESRIEMTRSSLGYTIISRAADGLEVEVPYFRTDVEVEDDLVSDILRINNYQNIPSAMINSASPEEITPEIYRLEERLRDILVSLGLHEHITNPLVNPDPANQEQIKLENSFASDRAALRTSIIETLEPVVVNYKKHRAKEIGLFEIGFTYEKPNVEKRGLQVIYEKENLSPLENSREIKRILSAITEALEIIDPFSVEPKLTYRSIYLSTEKLMRLSKLPNQNRIQTKLVNERTEDLSLVLQQSHKFCEIYRAIKNFCIYIKNVEVLEEYLDRKLGGGKKSILVRVTFDQDFDTKKENLIKLLQENFPVEIKK